MVASAFHVNEVPRTKAQVPAHVLEGKGMSDNLSYDVGYRDGVNAGHVLANENMQAEISRLTRDLEEARLQILQGFNRITFQGGNDGHSKIAEPDDGKITHKDGTHIRRPRNYHRRERADDAHAAASNAGLRTVAQGTCYRIAFLER